MELFKALQLKDKAMVALVGAGGKTSLMLKLASESARRGSRVLVTTTTKMLTSQLEGCGTLILEQDSDKLLQELNLSPDISLVTAAAAAVNKQNKVVGFSCETLDAIYRAGIFDFILVEADGARGLPLKAPAAYEPILPSSITHVLAVTGIDALNRPLTENHVHRCHLVAQLAGQQLDTLVVEETILHVVRRYAGLARQVSSGVRFIPVINKVDSDSYLEKAKRVVSLLLEEFEMVLMTTALSPDPVREVLL